MNTCTYPIHLGLPLLCQQLLFLKSDLSQLGGGLKKGKARLGLERIQLGGL